MHYGHPQMPCWQPTFDRQPTVGRPPLLVVVSPPTMSGHRERQP